MAKGKQNMAKVATLLSFVSMFSLIFSFVQESVFAYFFGASQLTDAYNVAIQIPITVFSLISTGITNIVIPCYSKELYKKDRESAKRYASNLISIITFVSLILIVVGELFGNYIVLVFAPGMGGMARECATNVFRLVLPTILLTEIMNINIGILNVHKSFILPSITSNLLNVSFVTCVALLQGRFGIYAAVTGTIIGTAIEFLYTEVLRRRYMKYKFIVDFHDETMLQSFKMAIPIFLGISATEINKLVDRIVASFLQEGSISVLNYATKLSSALSTLLVTGVSTVVYPELAKYSAKDDKKTVARIFSKAINIYIIILIPTIAGIGVLGEEAIKIVYGRGAFTMETVRRTSPLFFCYAICLIFTCFRQVSSRVFYSAGDSKTPMKNSMIGIAINIVLNIVLGYYIGAIGLALATTISAMVISFLLFVEIKKDNEFVNYKSNLKLAGKCLFATMVMTMIICAVKKVASVFEIYNIEDMWSTIVFGIVVSLFGAGIYFILLIIEKVEELDIILNKIRRRK